jgi:hypothetical protein
MRKKNGKREYPRVISLEEGRLLMAAKRGFRNWESRFKESFDLNTRLPQISIRTLSHLAQGKDKGTFYLYDLIMNLQDLGSGFEFNELSPKKKMGVIDQYLFLLDQIRFECMKRLGWLESYPGEQFTLVELINRFDELAPSLQAKVPVLSRNHTAHAQYTAVNTHEKESIIRKLIPEALKRIQTYSE